MMKRILFNQQDQRNFTSIFEQDFDDLVFGRRTGHMGQHEYVSSSMHLWTKFIKEYEKQYYIPACEVDLIVKAGKLSASLLGDKPVTLVSRGCGTKFLTKEGLFAKQLMNVAGVVYLDRCETALDQSIAEGWSLFPNAWHKGIKCDIFDPNLEYPVEGTEVSTCFGLTLFNVEGFPFSRAPMNAYKENMKALAQQMLPGAHFITTCDHNQDYQTVELAYAGQKEFAKHMLQRTGAIDPNSVDFVVKFFKSSQTLCHGYQFRRDTIVSSRSGTKAFMADDVLWFNNSVKPTYQHIKKWNASTGFSYARLDKCFDSKNYLGWHHLIKKAAV